MSNYDSAQDTVEHIGRVEKFLKDVIVNLEKRSINHDASKLKEPEKSFYDEFKPKISAVENEFGYGSLQYEEVVNKAKELSKTHWANNSHHPEHYPNGINGMSLLDVIEMISDWKAVTTKSGQPLNLDANKRRFKMDDQLFEIIKNTIKEMGW